MRISDWSSDVCSSDLGAMAGTDAQSLDRRVFHAQQACCFRRGVVYRLEIRRLGHQVGIPDDIVAAGTAVIVVTCRQLHVQSLQAWPGVGLAEQRHPQLRVRTAHVLRARWKNSHELGWRARIGPLRHMALPARLLVATEVTRTSAQRKLPERANKNTKDWRARN